VKTRPRSYRPLSVVGLELEYAIVDAELRPRCLVEDAFRALHGRPTSNVVLDGVGFSNELAAHVFEAKMLRPGEDLAAAEQQLVAATRRFQALLRNSFGVRLLPTGMHPLMKPKDTALWRRGGNRIYAAYARVFDVRQHGWVNVQSCQINLPFGRTERELVLLYNAVACLLPYLPCIAASSPLVEGRVGPYLDNRLAHYRRNQRRIPAVSGNVVPEFIRSVREYRSRVLAPIYAALKEVEGADVLCHDWVNSRGAILRFARRALEIRILDTQECIRMDVAIAAFVRAALRWSVRALAIGEMDLPTHGMLVDDFDLVIATGRRAQVQARHLGGPARAADVVLWLLERARACARAHEARYLDLVESRIEKGSLAEGIRARLRTRVGEPADPSRVRSIYEDLMDCLDANRPWWP